MSDDSSPGTWTFLTNHSYVLMCLVRNPFMLLREVAAQVGITERAVIRIVGDLEAAGALQRDRVGRRNRYTVDLSVPLRHPMEAHRTIGELLSAVLETKIR